MASYGDLDAIRRILGNEQTTWTADDDLRLEAINAAVSLLFEERTNRVFGTGVQSATVTVYGAGFDRLVLPKPLRSITSVTTGGTWNGTSYTGGTLLTTAAVRLGPTGTRGEGYVLDRADGGFWPLNEPVVIVGTWADTDSDSDVPDDVTYAVNYLVAMQWRDEHASPEGVTGPDGFQLTVRDGWMHTMVRDTIRKYRVSRVAV